jgi:ELWxxDGT repeat protein
MIVIAEDDTTGRELWRTNGTAVQQIIDLHPGDRDGVTFPFAAAVHGGFLYFAGDDDIDGSELWRTDGTMAGTTQVADIRPGSLGSRPASMVLANGQILFSADDGTTGRELWATNASGTSAQRITDLDNGPESSLNDDVTGFPGPSGDFLFVAETGDLGMELWRTDGTLGGTLRLTDVTEPVSSFPRFLTPWRGGLACKLYLGPTAAQLVTVDGVTLDSTVHSFPDPADYDLSESLVVWNDTLFLDEEFAGSLGQKLWTWDGMSETLIAEITGIPTMGSLYPTTDGVVFAREDELHRTDGTSVASMDDLVIDPTLPGGIILSTQENLILLQDYTSDTTYRVDLDDNSVITYPSLTTDGSQWRHFLGTVGGVSYFTTLTTLDPVLFVWETNLWASDGTPAGTEKLMVLPGVINPDVLEIDGQAHIIVPGTGAASWELHATDGTAAGTVLVASGPSYVRNWVAGETWAVLDTDDGLVLTDGTAAGSMLLPDTVGAGVHQALDGWALVSTIEEGRGLELALVNAADGSIVPLPEIQPGPAGTSIFYTVVADQRLWVTAFRADVGNELFTLDLTPFITAPSAALFSDGFESGDVTSWLGSVP